ncbi:ECF RNA polymerase sigma factor SigE [Polystyrenella longa]|uniref:ECF RNA polymerase sigma factor SigE n=1 Tax=Polystyrenella longa TaxID=2528007 RepID=A0A518CKP7_9PLAN|nr:sigma-70 family RNA polymerase sigma factor [Polystyrenella longa]QDU79799.1 ECF RNA polymerase sigma factor SigE [Polystyrenella longa]
MNKPMASQATFKEDAELLRRAVEDRDSAALEALIERHSGLVMGIAQQMVSNRDDAGEVFQATFLKLVEHSDRIRDRQAVAAWLFQVAQNESRQLLRRRKREPVSSSPEILEQSVMAPTPSDSPAELQFLLEEIEQLPEKYQPSIILCCLEGQSREDAAARLGLTSMTVKGRLERGRKLLKQRLLKRGVGLAALLSVWQANQATAATMVSTALLQQTVQSCTSSVLLTTTGSTAVTTSTFSKGAILMSISGKGKLLFAVSMGLLFIGGGAVFVMNSGSSESTPAAIAVKQAEAQKQLESIGPVGLTSELMKLVELVKEQENRYRNMEVKLHSNAEFHLPLSNPQPGFDVSPDHPTGEWDDSMAGDGNSLRPMPKYVTLEVQGVAQQEKFNIRHKHTSTFSVLGMSDSEEVVSQEYMTHVRETQFLYDGRTLNLRDSVRPPKQVATTEIEQGYLLPHSVLLLQRHIARPLSAVLAGEKPNEHQKLISQRDWYTTCEILGEETVKGEPVIKVRCLSSLPDSYGEQDWYDYFYLAVNRNYIPIRSESTMVSDPQILQSYEITSWQELEPGQWYPQISTASISSPGPSGMDESKVMTMETKYEVISTETEYPDEFFQYNEEEKTQ